MNQKEFENYMNQKFDKNINKLCPPQKEFVDAEFNLGKNAKSNKNQVQ